MNCPNNGASIGIIVGSICAALLFVFIVVLNVVLCRRRRRSIQRQRRQNVSRPKLTTNKNKRIFVVKRTGLRHTLLHRRVWWTTCSQSRSTSLQSESRSTTLSTRRHQGRCTENIRITVRTRATTTATITRPHTEKKQEIAIFH